jgi:hypothetical protein
VRLLFDQNLSRHLLRELAVEYPDSRHVTDVGLDIANVLRGHLDDVTRFAATEDEALLVLPAA